jgi:hypothetical protein
VCQNGAMVNLIASWVGRVILWIRGSEVEYCFDKAMHWIEAVRIEGLWFG